MGFTQTILLRRNWVVRVVIILIFAFQIRFQTKMITWKWDFSHISYITKAWFCKMSSLTNTPIYVKDKITFMSSERFSKTNFPFTLFLQDRSSCSDNTKSNQYGMYPVMSFFSFTGWYYKFESILQQRLSIFPKCKTPHKIKPNTILKITYKDKPNSTPYM